MLLRSCIDSCMRRKARLVKLGQSSVCFANRSWLFLLSCWGDTAMCVYSVHLNSYSNTRFLICWKYLQVPYTFVRASSDYVHLPVELQDDGTWAEIETVPAVDFVNGYRYEFKCHSATRTRSATIGMNFQQGTLYYFQNQTAWHSSHVKGCDEVRHSSSIVHKSQEICWCSNMNSLSKLLPPEKWWKTLAIYTIHLILIG